jgi:hypothetical protein
MPEMRDHGARFRPGDDPEQLLPMPVRCEPTRGYEEGNLVFVALVVGNSMRNGHASFTQCAEAFGVLAAGRAMALGVAVVAVSRSALRCDAPRLASLEPVGRQVSPPRARREPGGTELAADGVAAQISHSRQSTQSCAVRAGPRSTAGSGTGHIARLLALMALTAARRATSQWIEAQTEHRSSSLELQTESAYVDVAGGSVHGCKR